MLKHFIPLFLLLTLPLQALTRGAVDMGPSGLKVTVADVDTKAKKITKIFYSREEPVPFKRDMQVSGKPVYSEEIQQLAIDTLAAVKRNLSKYEPIQWSGIATASARSADNASLLLSRIKTQLGIPITIVSQEEEGRIGFETAKAVFNAPKEHIVSYDSGRASFQFAAHIDNKLEVFQGPFAYIGALTALVTEVRNGVLDLKSSPGAVSLEEAKTLTAILKNKLPDMPETFAQKLRDKKTQVVGIGNQFFVTSTCAIATKKKTFTKEELWEAIVAHTGLDDEELSQFPKPHEAVVGMILVYSVMDRYDIDVMNYAHAMGCCEGLLIDPAYWTKS